MIILFFFSEHILALLTSLLSEIVLILKHFIEARNWKLKNNNWARLLQRKQDVIFSTRTSTLILLQDNRLKQKQKQKQKKQIKEFNRLKILKTNEVQINWNRKIHRLGERCGAVASERSLWLGFDSWTWYHMCVEFLVGPCPCSEVFSPSPPVFPPPLKPTF